MTRRSASTAIIGSTQVKPAIDIVTAMNDPALFQPWFPGETWDGWRAVLKGAFGLAMSAEEIAFFRTVAERDPPQRQVKELWCVVGRRGGKDSVASLIAAHTSALFSEGHRLRPGERALVACLASDRDQSKIVLNYTRSYFADVELLKGMVQRETSGFELINSVDVAITTNSFRAVRGRPILCAILDELAFWQDENSANPDEEVLAAIKPALASLPGSIVIGISSPYRKKGLLYNKFKRHFGKDGDILVIRAATRQLNPTIPQSVIDEALEEDLASAKSEWQAQFRDDIGSWLDFAQIEQAVDRGVTVRPPSSNRFQYWSFCDPSGGARDSFTAAIAHAENDVAVLDCIVEVKAPFNPTSATEQITNTLKSYGLRSTMGDRYGAAWITDAFAQCEISYAHSERDRSAIYLDALPLFTSGRVRLLDNNRMVNQFAALERRTSSLGKDRIDHGVGGHDDLCNSAAGALVRAIHEKQPQRTRQIQINYMGR
jgi:hypothetical protein